MRVVGPPSVGDLKANPGLLWVWLPLFVPLPPKVFLSVCLHPSAEHWSLVTPRSPGSSHVLFGAPRDISQDRLSSHELLTGWGVCGHLPQAEHVDHDEWLQVGFGVVT